MNSDVAAAYCRENFPRFLDDLKTLVRIPSISFPGFPAEEVARSADATAELLKKHGFEKVEVLSIGKAHPYVYGEKIIDKKLPTLLLYAHHDVQPPGRSEIWKSEPFEPVVMDGPGGKRLYGRGTADDKAGIIVHVAAVASFLQTQKTLPVNVKIIVEGEEEAGSMHLGEFLKTYRSRLDADVMVLTDTTNFDCGVPALTIALRGLVGVEVEVRALTKTVHSGMWGGPLPDPAMALCKVLAKMMDDNGRIAIPGVLDDVLPLSKDEERNMLAVPYDEGDFRKQSGLVPNAKILQEGPNPLGQLWRFPSLSVNAIQASSRAQAGNVINDAAWARLTIRLASSMQPQKVARALKEFIEKNVPWGLSVTMKEDRASGPWCTEPVGPAFEAADVALEKGYGKAPLKIGCGGSIPFVKPFADALGGVPVLLVGVEDPYTNAHGENESLLISDLEKACLSQIYLFTELAQRIKVGSK